MKKVLFVVAQAGQAAYFLPLWERWASKSGIKNGRPDWGILAHKHAKRVIEKSTEDVQSYYVESWDKCFESAISEFGKWGKPDVVVSSACGKQREIEASVYAHKHRIKHIQVIDSWYKYATRIQRSNEKYVLPDVITVIDDWARNIAIDQKLPEDRIVCAGHPAWEQSMQYGMTKGRKSQVLFASQPLSEIPEMSCLGYNEHDVWDHLLAFRTVYPELIEELVYHPHPSQVHRPSSLPEYVRFSRQGENPIQTCGTMVSMFSAIMVEGYLAGQNVIGLQPDLQTDNICPLQKRKYIGHITNYDFDALAIALKKSPLNEKSNELKSAIAGSMKRLEDIILK